MKKKFPIGLVFAGVALLAVSAVCVLTMLGTFEYLRQNSPGWDFNVNRFQGIAEDTVTFDPEDAVGIRMDWSYGNFTIIQTEEDNIRMELYKVAYGGSQEEADQKVQGLTVDANMEQDWMVFSFQKPTQSNVVVVQDIAPSIDVVLYVPEGLDVEINNVGGEVTADGFNGALLIDNNYGNVTISDLTGNLSVETMNAELKLTNIDAGNNPVRLVSQYGSITLEDVTSGELQIESQNGSIDITGLKASGTCQVESNFGSVSFQTFSCTELGINSQSGEVVLDDGEIQGDVSVKSEFAMITLSQVFATNYTLESSSSDIKADPVFGVVKVNTGFGNIDLANGENCVLELNNENGTISYSGSLSSEEDHTIVGSYGAVTLQLPQDTNLDIDLKTEYGTIETAFPVTLQGQIDPKAMEGKINAGGALLKVQSTNSDIVLEVQP